MGKKLLLLAALASMVMWAGCSSSGSSNNDGGADIPTIDTISALPKATGGMGAATSSSLSKSLTPATTGMPFLSTDASSFDPDRSSRGSCEMFNQVKNGLGAAVQGDMILCFVGYLADNAASTGMSDPYDGQYHIYNLNVQAAEGSHGTPDKVKLKIVKNVATGSIEEFEMFMCKDSSQVGYLRQVVSGKTFTMDAVDVNTEADWNDPNMSRLYKRLVDVDGELNKDAKFTSKTIVLSNVGQLLTTDEYNWQVGTILQSLGQFSFNGYMKQSGTQYDGYQAADGVAQAVSDADGLTALLALGNGAVEFVQSNESNGQTFANSSDEAWLGDSPFASLGMCTGMAAGENEWCDVLAGSSHVPPTPGSAPTIAFATEPVNQTWDCTDPGEELNAVQESDMNAACGVYAQLNQGQWINCWQVFGCGKSDFCSMLSNGAQDDNTRNLIVTTCHTCFDNSANWTEKQSCLNDYLCAVSGDPTGCENNVQMMINGQQCGQ